MTWQGAGQGSREPNGQGKRAGEQPSVRGSDAARYMPCSVSGRMLRMAMKKRGFVRKPWGRGDGTDIDTPQLGDQRRRMTRRKVTQIACATTLALGLLGGAARAADTPDAWVTMKTKLSLMTTEGSAPPISTSIP